MGIHSPLYHYDLIELQQLMKTIPGTGENHEINRALQVLQGYEAHGFASLGLVWADAADNSSHPHAFIRPGFGELSREVSDGLDKIIHNRVERMIGYV